MLNHYLYKHLTGRSYFYSGTCMRLRNPYCIHEYMSCIYVYVTSIRRDKRKVVIVLGLAYRNRRLATCERLTENVCAVCDVMEMCVSDCIRISEKTRHTRFRLGACKTPAYRRAVRWTNATRRRKIEKHGHGIFDYAGSITG